MTRPRGIEIHLPARTGRFLVAVAGAAYAHLLVAVVLLALGTGTAAAPPLRIPPTLAVRLVPGPPSAPPSRPAAARPAPAAPVEPPPLPTKRDAVREVPPKKPETKRASKPESKPETKPAVKPAPPAEAPPATAAAGPAEVENPGAAMGDGGSAVGGLEGVPGVESYNQRIAAILSTFIPWRQLVLPPGSPPRVLTVAFLARREGERGRIERAIVASPSGYDAFDRAVERAVREMAVVPLPAGTPGDFLSFRYEVVLNAAPGP